MIADIILPKFCAVVVAGGSGERAGQSLPKQFASFRGKPLLTHSVEALASWGSRQIVVVHPAGTAELVASILGNLPAAITLAEGGATRQQSVSRGLDALNGETNFVLIHDAARPGLTVGVVERLLAVLCSTEGAVPVLPVVDSLAAGTAGVITEYADRDSFWRVQTPQAFHLQAIRAAHAAWSGRPFAGDDAQVLQANGGNIVMVEGDERLQKITFASDFISDVPPVRIGSGFDVHRLVAGEELWLGGIRIEHPLGLSGHSDADVVLHALVDALLGAIGEGDIGTHFPPTDPQWQGASSDKFLRYAASLVQQHGYSIGNIDLTIICEAPKIGPHRTAMRTRVAELVQVSPASISIKATTTEGLGFTGRGEGIAAQAVATIFRQP